MTYCPSCKHKQSMVNRDCESCGIVFEKFMNYVPVKILGDKRLSPSEIKDIKETDKRFSRIKHDASSKTELIMHCKKQKLLDLAAYYAGKENNSQEINLIKNMGKTLFNEKDPKTSSLLGRLDLSPFLLVSLAVMATVIAIFIFVSIYI